MNEIIRKIVWNFLSSLPSALELTVWILLGISIIALVEVIIFFVSSLVKDKKEKKNKKLSNNELQLDLQNMKQETKDWNNCLNWKDKLAWFLKWRLREILKATIVLLIIVIIGLIMFFNFNYSDGKATIKPSETPSEVIKKIKK